MYKENDKYQNILTQLHELNRNIVLSENEKTEQIIQKIDSLEEKINNSSLPVNKKVGDKFQILVILISLINTFLLVFLLFNYNFSEEAKIEEKILPEIIEKETKIDDTKIEEESNDEILSFNDKSIEVFEEKDEYSDIKPIIRKGTKYSCKDDSNTYKIPYTVEIKGKLYSDEFKFILNENSITKECTIKKELM